MAVLVAMFYRIFYLIYGDGLVVEVNYLLKVNIDYYFEVNIIISSKIVNIYIYIFFWLIWLITL